MALSVCLLVIAGVLGLEAADIDVRFRRSASFRQLNAEDATTVLRHATPNVDFPIFREIPRTSFTCTNIQPGTYRSDAETGCQVFHFCDLDGQISGSFLCPNYTIFNDQSQVCEWFHNVDCSARFTGVIPVANTVHVMPVATISSDQFQKVNEIQTSQSSHTSSISSASKKNCDEKPGLVIPVVQEAKKVYPVISIATEAANPLTNFQAHKAPASEGFPNAVGHVGESKEVHVSESVRPVTAVIAQPVANIATEQSSKTNEEVDASSSSSRNSSWGSSSVTSQEGGETRLKPEAVTPKPTPVPTKPTPVPTKPTPVTTKPTPVPTKPTPVTTKPESEIPAKPTPIPSSIIDTNKSNATSDAGYTSATSHTTTNELGSGISGLQAKSGWGAKSSQAAPAQATLLAIPQTLGYNGGQNFVSSGMDPAALGAGATQMLHPAQQIQLYSQGVANPFIVDPFFAPLRMYSGAAGMFLQPALGMLGMG